MADPVKSRVDSAAWPASAAPVAGPARRRPGLRAAIGRALALCLLSAALYFWLGWVRIAAALAVAGAAMIVLAAAWPGGYAAMDRFARAFGRGIGACGVIAGGVPAVSGIGCAGCVHQTVSR